MVAKGYTIFGFINPPMEEVIGDPILVGTIIGIFIGSMRYFVSLPNDHNTRMNIFYRYH
jgi:hypothetical protein